MHIVHCFQGHTKGILKNHQIPQARKRQCLLMKLTMASAMCLANFDKALSSVSGHASDARAAICRKAVVAKRPSTLDFNFPIMFRFANLECGTVPLLWKWWASKLTNYSWSLISTALEDSQSYKTPWKAQFKPKYSAINTSIPFPQPKHAIWVCQKTL